MSVKKMLCALVLSTFVTGAYAQPTDVTATGDASMSGTKKTPKKMNKMPAKKKSAARMDGPTGTGTDSTLSGSNTNGAEAGAEKTAEAEAATKGN